MDKDIPPVIYWGMWMHCVGTGTQVLVIEDKKYAPSKKKQKKNEENFWQQAKSENDDWRLPRWP